MLRIKSQSLAWSCALSSVFALPALAGEWPLNMTEGVTEISKEVFGLHMLIFGICVVIGVIVFGVMFYSMFAHRKSRGAKASNFHESTTLELIWTIIPALILVAMAVPATNALIKIYDTSDSDVDILVTGYQWKWKYEYLGEDVSFFSNLSTPRDQIENRAEKGEHYLLEVDEPLYIPTGKKIRFLVTADDVIHSWWVPEIAVKRDAIPGYVNEAWTWVDEPGVFRGQCAELCGKDHGFMPIEVHAVEPEKYAMWMNDKKAQAAAIKAALSKTFSFDELYTMGETAYRTSCAACHGVNGEGGVGPAIKGSAVANGPVAAHLDIVINGSKNNAMMQAFGKQLDAATLGAIITYQRNAFNNNTGDKIQPVDVVKFKQK